MTLGIKIECHYAECHIFLIVMLIVIMPSVVMLDVIMLSVVAPCLLSWFVLPYLNVNVIKITFFVIDDDTNSASVLVADFFSQIHRNERNNKMQADNNIWNSHL
jgi:hypothetical protein